MSAVPPVKQQQQPGQGQSDRDRALALLTSIEEFPLHVIRSTESADSNKFRNTITTDPQGACQGSRLRQSLIKFSFLALLSRRRCASFTPIPSLIAFCSLPLHLAVIEAAKMRRSDLLEKLMVLGANPFSRDSVRGFFSSWTSWYHIVHLPMHNNRMGPALSTRPTSLRESRHSAIPISDKLRISRRAIALPSKIHVFLAIPTR